MKNYLVGVDEVGRGCLFGPVIAAAVILGNYTNSELKDSKKLSKKNRNILYTVQKGVLTRCQVSNDTGSCISVRLHWEV